MKQVVLSLGPSGEPLAPGNSSNGVLFLNSYHYSSDSKDPIYLLTFVISAASKTSRNGTLNSNIPPNSGTRFSRETFYEHKIDQSFHKDTQLSLEIYKPGVYCYFVTYGTDDSADTTTESERYYFVVQPSLSLNKDYVTLNSVSIQSLVSKWMGPLSEWHNTLQYVSSKGYNMIHFTPLQSRGSSNSPYSIYDQLSFDPNLFSSSGHVESFIEEIRAKYGLLSLTDVVWNHTANNSPWLNDHPESGYSVDTAPHLTAAVELDSELLKFSHNLAYYNLPTTLQTEADLDAVMSSLELHVLQKLSLWEYYVIDVSSFLDELQKYLQSNPNVSKIDIDDSTKQNIPKLAQFTLDFCGKTDVYTLGTRRGKSLSVSEFATVLNSVQPQDYLTLARQLVDEINLRFYKEFDADLVTIKSQIRDRIRYLRLDPNGPKMGEITVESPLTERFFTYLDTGVALANNGWVWGGSPLVDFASKDSKAYLLRQVIVWEDCVKLRYGKSPEDSPYLWKRMIEYTQLCAKIFDGFRIDNCHSTPLHVGEALIDAAREVNPNLYVVAELFSGSEYLDKVFVERLGICSLIREAMQAWSEQELSRTVHRHAGRPIGSFKWLPLDDFAYDVTSKRSVGSKASEVEIPRPVEYQDCHALFMDCTHDNETPYQKRTVEDTLPNAALVALCSCAVGSVFGYDECYPKLLNVVTETRRYGYTEKCGIFTVKQKLNAIRNKLSTEQDSIEDQEMHVHHEGEYITLQRQNARTGLGWFLVARCKFGTSDSKQTLSPVFLAGTECTYEFGYSLRQAGSPSESKTVIEGIPVTLNEVAEPEISRETGGTRIAFPNQEQFPKGSIAVFSTRIIGVDESLDKFVQTGALEAANSLTLYDLNALLYKCDAEERDYSQGSTGVYEIPEYGKLVYAGFQGWISMLGSVIKSNELAHGYANNLREGVWALDYACDRLQKYSTDTMEPFLKWFQSRTNAVKKVPYFLRPRYFALLLGIAYEACRYVAISKLSPMFRNGTLFLQDLGLTSIQMVGNNESASLKPFEKFPSMAAGLPHFSSSYMRCWGRDIFISLRGLLLATERFGDAREHIVAAASVLKHGLIPNLIDSCRNPRYNARDATWFWLQSVQDYVKLAPEGAKILDVKVKRRFPKDDTYVTHDSPEAFSYESSVREVIFEIFQRHALGQEFREANAGPNLDSQMKDEGFNIKIHVDWDNGLIFGGSQFNCGTWMDKMGESEKAGNKGVPGTPRDGAAVEISGLLKSALRFVNELSRNGHFHEKGVKNQHGEFVTFQEWEAKVMQNFEKVYYVPENPEDDSLYDVNSGIVNRRGIYKDLYRSGKEYEDYQLRPNFPIAMVVAPELFTPQHALHALNVADKVIRGPVGMRTLDPSDYNYRPYYNNSEDSDDFSTSKGRNYHSGPEWVWCTGYFLRAFAHFHKYGTDASDESLQRDLMSKLEGHKEWIHASVWRGLTELTNKDGDFCGDSSPTQAWSSACLIDLFLDM